MNLSLKSPSHLRRVAALPYKTLMFKIDLISTLSCRLSVASL